MTEKEMFEFLYKLFKKTELNAKETAQAIGWSYSKFTKLFSGREALSEKFIKEHKIIPTWTRATNKSSRRWKIKEIARWLVDTEEKS
jgi:hypothetical protein